MSASLLSLFLLPSMAQTQHEQDDTFGCGQPYAIATIAEELDLDLLSLDTLELSAHGGVQRRRSSSSAAAALDEPAAAALPIDGRILVTWPRDPLLEKAILASATDARSSVVTLILDDGSMSCANFRYIRHTAPEVCAHARTHATPTGARSGPSHRAATLLRRLPCPPRPRPPARPPAPPTRRSTHRVRARAHGPPSARARRRPQAVRTGECDRRLFGPIAVALRDGPHEAASVREVARLLSKLMLGHDRTSESTDPLLQLRYALGDSVRALLHPGDGKVVPARAPFQREEHPHAAARALAAQSKTFGRVVRR
jgi:hypothetical protein